MFKKIRTVRGAVAEAKAYAADLKYYLEENKEVYRGIAIGFVIGAGIVVVLKPKSVVVNNVINVCSH
jgi:hypothetical protein